MNSKPPTSRYALLACLMSSAALVAACGGGVDEQSASDASPIAAPAPPPPPATQGSATLAWTAPAGPVAGYRVYYGTASGTYNQALGSGTYVTAPTVTLSGLPSRRSYYFAVTAIDLTGAESTYSNEATKLIP
jgi:hypothetical protein